MVATCQSCGKSFPTQRSTAKWCGETCKKRAQRRPSTPVASAAPIQQVPDPVSPLLAAVCRELEAAGVLETVAGQQALVVAARVTSPHETGSAVAALSKQLQALTAEALGSVRSVDRLDELRQRRDVKRAG